MVEDVSITTEAVQKLVIDRKDLDSMDGKRILIVDDVISTGSLHALENACKQEQGHGCGARLCWRKATRQTVRISFIWSRCPCFSNSPV